MSTLTASELERLLFEDAPYGDLTTEALRIGEAMGSIRFTARGPMVVAAIDEAAALFALCGVAARPRVKAGDRVAAGAILLEGEGPTKGLMKAWKVAQTLMEIWSGVAGAARALVASARAARPDVVVACTRKNVPGTKALAIAAIKAGGAAPHRLGLSETILVFPQHRVFRPNVAFSTLATELRGEAPEKKLVVEVGSVGEAIAAAEAGFDVVQTEKFDPQEVEETARAFAALSRRPVLAAAGGIHPENAAAYALAGADVLVTSWPYTARPTDVAVTMGAL